MCLHINWMRNIFFYGSPCVSSNFLNNGYSEFTSHTNCIYLSSLTHDLHCEYPHHDTISHTHSIFLTQALHCVFLTHACFEIISLQTAFTFPWPMVCNMVYQITDTMKMLLTQYTQTAFVFLFQSIRERERVYSNSDIVHTKIYM